VQEPIIEISNLTKHYGKLLAVSSLSLRVNKDEVFGFLGPNGAGKTTTIKILVGQLNPSAGSAKIFGYDVVKDRKKVLEKVGYMPELPRFPVYLSGEELLNLYAKFYRIPVGERQKKIKEFLEFAGLWERRKDKIGRYSKGMLQRLGFAQALINDPELAVLDEPTIGLDPEVTVEFRTAIKELPKKGTTVFVSSHLLNEVQQACSHVAIINRGKLVVSGRVDELIDRFTETIIEIELAEVNERVVKALSKLEFTKEVKVEGKMIRLVPSTREDVRERIAKTIQENGGLALTIRPIKSTLEDVYLQLMKG